MYLITIYDGPNDGQGTIINSPFMGDPKCRYKIHPVLVGVSDMEITLNPANPGWNKIKPLRTLITVTNQKTGKLEFSGRVLKPTESMSQDGMFTIKYVCESKMAFLNDSMQRYAGFQSSTVKGLLQHMINVHNAQVEPHKRFIVGNVTVTDPNNNVYRHLDYENTFDAIQDKLIDRLGGYLVIREETDGTYLDYLKEVGTVRDTPIQLRVNLKSLQREIDPTAIITRLIVLGAKVSEDTDNHERLTFKSVNGGKDYLDNPALIAEFGIIEGVLTYDDINTPSTLLLRAQQFFADQKASQNSYTVSALDLSKIDMTFEEFVVGDWYPVGADPMGINEPLQVIGRTITDDAIHMDTLEIGDKYKTLSQYQYETNKKMRSYDQIRQQVDSQAITIRNLGNQLAEASQTVGQIQDSLQDIDIENLPVELQGIYGQLSELQGTLDDIEFAIGEIPVYGPASSTNSGLLIPELYMKLVAIDLATQLVDGLMSKDDKKKMDLISVTEPINLDNLVARIEALENS